MVIECVVLIMLIIIEDYRDNLIESQCRIGEYTSPLTGVTVTGNPIGVSAMVADKGGVDSREDEVAYFLIVRLRSCNITGSGIDNSTLPKKQL